VKALKGRPAASLWLMVLGGVIGWIVLMIYCWGEDRQAFWLSLILPPVFGTFLILAARTRSVVLTLFFGLTFVSHAIAPPFFFINRDLYHYTGGFGAVKDFQFGVGEFLRMYVPVLVFVLALLLFGMLFLRVARRTGRRSTPVLAPRDRGSMRRARYDFAIALFLILVAIPQTVIMYGLKQGITGLVSEPLPYRLTGLLYYSRMFLYPMLLFMAYAASRRYLATGMLILLYASIAGMAASSRYVLLASAAPMLVLTILDRRRMRLLVALALMFGAFVLVTRTRDYVYRPLRPSFTGLVTRSIQGTDGAAGFSIPDTIGGLANRLWGPQDVVLAYQYDIPSRGRAIWRYFTSQPVVDDLTFEFYGLTFAYGSGMGVGLGIIPWMVVLSRRSIIVLILLAAIVALMLVVADRLVLAIRTTRGSLGPMAADPLAFLFVYTLYPSTINWYFDLLVLVIGMLIVLRMFAGGVRIRRPKAVPA
jgi:hypothetical protein